ncbi:hypothetical protein ODJ79_19810 [Actinoplanes sp. KI2]|uniref:hypothetical protein n=1 Tax=Actinoplanes sp. KI2 TaxID=2983315 RepID=UPI0021D5B474|nr:hypothetical protein [Actinoplanes sp. KI2]MCU7725976.1 hypothetical protein [Actinoplanes sp. KI2]
MTASADVRGQVASLREAFVSGTLRLADFDRLDAALARPAAQQRLLYLHALSPFLGSRVISAALHEPEPGRLAAIDPTTVDLPYETVHDAVVDGWHVVQFPQLRAPFDDEELDVLGYQFILQMLV